MRISLKRLKPETMSLLKKKRFKPTDQGILTVETLSQYFKQIMDTAIHQTLESKLDLIADGQVEHIQLLKDFYNSFMPVLESAQENMEKIQPVVTDKLCPLCGGNLVVRRSKYGEFLGCGNFPKCKHIEEIEKIIVL